ncbi:MAG: GAF and ANTAR domain-containing protein [Acidimicrobiales bacterium]
MTSRRLARILDLQFSTGKGPAINAHRSRRPVLEPELGTATRWPAFAPEAVTAGATAVFALPLQVGAARFGALTFYRDRPGPLGEGRCVDASVNGHWFHVESLDQETRWPAFVPRAKKLGINAILSTQLMARSQPVGALNIYSRTRAAFASKEQELASVFATEASAILTDAGADVSDGQLAQRQREALAAREVIALAQGQGVLMERDGVSQHDRYTLLRRFSQRVDRPLIERAEDVVTSTRWSQPDPAPTLRAGWAAPVIAEPT